MAKMMQGTLANIKEAFRRPIWEEPNLQYDGTEPPKGWLERLKQLRQIHGYNDKEIVHIAERCMKGSAQLWFRIHHPKCFEALRTGLHTRFASGPVLVPATATPQASAGRLGCTSPAKLNPRSLVPNVVRDKKSSPQNKLDLAPETNVLLHDATRKDVCPSEIPFKTAQTSPRSQVRSNSSVGPAQSRSHVAPRRSNSGPVRASSRRCCSSFMGSIAWRPVDANPNSASGRAAQDCKVVRDSSLKNAKHKMEILTRASYSIDSEGGECKDKGAKNMETGRSISLSSTRFSSDHMSRFTQLPDLSEGCPTGRWVEGSTNPLQNFANKLAGSPTEIQARYPSGHALGGDWTRMSSDFCKYYLRCYRMRTSGSKRELIHRIRDHLELTDGSGARKYPRNSFVIDCAGRKTSHKSFKKCENWASGVVCLGDVILFEQKLRTGFDVLNGNQFDNSVRTVVGRVVKDYKCASSQKQVFTVEVYWSKGQEAFRLMRPLHVTAKDLFSMRPLRQRWINEDARKGLLDEKKNCTLEKKARNGLKVAPPLSSRLSV